MYRGAVRNGLPHGRGSMVYRADDASGRLNYTGSWDRGALSGRGIMHWRNGAR